MPKNIHVNLATFKDKKKWTIAGKEYEVAFEQCAEDGFVARDVPDAVAGYLLSGKFPAFSEYRGARSASKVEYAPPPKVESETVEDDKPKRRTK